MAIVDTTKFAIGVALFAVGLVVLWQARGGRGFNQTRQAGALMLVGSGVFVAIGLGLIDV